MDNDDFLARPGTRAESRLFKPQGMDGGILSDKDEIEYIFCAPLDKIYECPVCSNVLRYPVLFEECGHRCCASCLPELLRIAPKCPIDGKIIDREREVIVDRTFQQELDALEVKCSHVHRGCTWFGQLKDLEMHIEDCRYTPIKCPKNCGMELEKSDLRKHLQEECTKRGIRCDFCHIPITQEEESTHLEVCGKFLLPCPNGCKKGEIPREEMEFHLEEKCPQQQIPCPFASAGCEFMSKRKHLHKHIKEDPISHLGMAIDTIISHGRELDSNMNQLATHTNKLAVLESKVDTLEKLYGCQLVWRIEKWEDKMSEAKLGRKPNIFSPPFLTTRHGYRMAMSLCPYGDGRARGKFLSIFICICKGEHDSLLTWPFTHRISFSLIDQCQDPKARRNITYTIKPNIIKDNKAFLGRPVGERNASFGAQKFVELEALKTMDYVRDDCVYIKCEIDSSEMTRL